MWLTVQERWTVLALGALALLAVGVLAWQHPRAPMGLEPGLASAAQWDASLQAARRVRLNAATAEELERLPEIGPSTAKRIVEYRQEHGAFRTVDDLQDVPGIGSKTLEAVRAYLTVEAE